MSPPALPWVQHLALAPPSLADNTADADRLVAELRRRLRADVLAVDLALLAAIPGILRQGGYRVRASLWREPGRWVLTALEAGEARRPVCGLAVDLGTTRVALRLCDMSDGRVLAESSFDNPQIALGADVLTRIRHAERPGGLKELQGKILDGLNAGIAGLCRGAGLEPDDVRALAVAGNTAMTHLFLGLEPRWLIREPYTPAVNRPGVLRAADLGIAAAACARVLVFPNIGSSFGGDLIAGILFSKLHSSRETALLVDVGTNAEVVLGNEHWLIGCAGAAGPALEGGVTQMGMMAAPGAVVRVAIDPATRAFTLLTIDALPPRGICGSGVIDLAAQLFAAGMIDIRGKLVPAACGGRLVEIDGLSHLVVVPAGESATGRPLTIGQAELDSLIRSKAAMYTILETLTQSVGVSLAELSAFYVAGTFGCFIDPRSAVTIGMLPDLPLERFTPLGNSSLAGAAAALTDPGALEEIDLIRDRITYLELNVNQDFMNRFSAARFLPHTDAARFPSVPIPAVPPA